MSLLLVLIAVTICFTVCETKERIASLIVLPPLVLGYDELYHDSKEISTNYSAPEIQARFESLKSTKSSELTQINETVAGPKKREPAAPTENKEPAASSKKKTPAVTKKKKKPAAPAKKNNTEKKPQRNIIIDTKGRRNFRRNYRSLLKKQKQNECTTCQLIRQDELY